VLGARGGRGADREGGRPRDAAPGGRAPTLGARMKSRAVLDDRMPRLEPLSSDPVGARALARAAIRARRAEPSEGEPFLSALESAVGTDSALGVVVRSESRSVGIAVWTPPSPIGTTLELFFLDEGARSAAAYRAFLDEIVRAHGPIAFAPGGLAGLSSVEEEAVMRGLGFAPFGRSELRFPVGTPPPRPRDTSLQPRPARADDRDALARLHERAYRGRFDRYLFLVDDDPARDAARAMEEIFGGRWGEFRPWASAVIDGADGPVAAALVVGAPFGLLVADVMVDPAHQGRGMGREVLTASLRAIRAREPSIVALAVTEGNARAERLYAGIGFVRALGPSYAWYSTERIPVAPAGG
jgi:ribosomal protein S18 acetylase RimI-like enzyme